MNVYTWALKTWWAVLLFVGLIRRDAYMMAFAATFLISMSIEGES